MEILIGILILLFSLSGLFRLITWIKQITRKILKKKKTGETGNFLLLTVGNNGAVTHLEFDEQSKANDAYLTAFSLTEEHSTFVALFDKAVMIKNNQERSTSI